MVVEPAYDEALEFHDGRAPVQVGEKWGYIDRHGMLVIPEEYALVGEFSEGLAAVARWRGLGWPTRIGYIDTAGKVVIQVEHYGEISEAGFRDGRALLWPKGLRCHRPLRLAKHYGYIDKSGEFAIAPQFDEAKPFSDGLAKVWTDEKAMYIDTTGKVVIDVTLHVHRRLLGGVGIRRRARRARRENRVHQSGGSACGRHCLRPS